MAKITKVIKTKKASPVVNEEIMGVETPVVEKGVIVVEHTFKQQILSQFDRLVVDLMNKFDRKTINRQELELILNSVFKS